MIKYRQIFNDLKKDILDQKYLPGDRLPSEHALALKYQVSRVTARNALNELLDDDLIIRIKGNGTFVKQNILTNGNKSATNRILVVLPLGNDTATGNYILGMTKVVTGTSWFLSVITNSEFYTLDPQYLKENYAGIIFYLDKLTFEIPFLLELKKLQVHVVILDLDSTNIFFPVVLSDNEKGGRLALQHLLDNGHKRIAFYSTTLFWENYNGALAQRFFGYIQQYPKHLIKNIKPLQWSKDLFSIKKPTQFLDYLKKEDISALVVANDVQAMQLIKEFNRLDISYHDWPAIVGFDNIKEASLSTPSLTTIAQDFSKIGQVAMERLIHNIQHSHQEDDSKVKINVHLIIRDSSLIKNKINNPKN